MNRSAPVLSASSDLPLKDHVRRPQLDKLPRHKGQPWLIPDSRGRREAAVPPRIIAVSVEWVKSNPMSWTARYFRGGPNYPRRQRPVGQQSIAGIRGRAPGCPREPSRAGRTGPARPDPKANPARNKPGPAGNRAGPIGNLMQTRSGTASKAIRERNPKPARVPSATGRRPGRNLVGERSRTHRGAVPHPSREQSDADGHGAVRRRVAEQSDAGSRSSPKQGRRPGPAPIGDAA
jgi:hypothetical protein